MADEYENENTNTESSSDDEDIWGMLGISENDLDDEYDSMQSDEDDEINRIDKTMKKYTSKMDERMKELDRKLLHERVNSFQKEADPVTLDFFKAVASDITTPEEFDKAVSLARKNAERIKAEAEKWKSKAQEEAREEAARAWGTGPIGNPAARKTPDYEKQRSEKIAKGDIAALTEALLEFTPPTVRK